MSVAPLVVVLLLHPVLAESTPLRLAATQDAGVVDWSLDGVFVGTTQPGHALRIDAAAGSHELRAVATTDAAWTAMARPEPTTTSGAAWVGAWQATAPGRTAGSGDRSGGAGDPSGPNGTGSLAHGFAGLTPRIVALMLVGLAILVIGGQRWSRGRRGNPLPVEAETDNDGLPPVDEEPNNTGPSGLHGGPPEGDRPEDDPRDDELAEANLPDDPRDHDLPDDRPDAELADDLLVDEPADDDLPDDDAPGDATDGRDGLEGMRASDRALDEAAHGWPPDVDAQTQQGTVAKTDS